MTYPRVPRVPIAASADTSGTSRQPVPRGAPQRAPLAWPPPRNAACQGGIHHIREMPPPPARLPGYLRGRPCRPLNGAGNPIPAGVWFQADSTGGDPYRVTVVPPTAVTNGWLAGLPTCRL